MRRGAGLEGEPDAQLPIGDRLRRFSGQMSKQEAQAIDRAISAVRQRDLELQE